MIYSFISLFQNQSISKSTDLHLSLTSYLSICFVLCLSLCLGCDSLSSPKDAVQVANACVEADLISACPVGTSPNLKAQADATCNSSGSVHIETIQESGGGEVKNVCVGSGTCQVVCELFMPCKNGIKSITKESIECQIEATAVCGNQSCEVGESQESCPRDCAGDCIPLEERCNGLNREYCNQRGIWEALNCLETEKCKLLPNDSSKTFCASDEICDGLDNDGNSVVDDPNLLKPEPSNLQMGVCMGNFKVCIDGSWHEPNYHDLLLYEDDEQICDSLDNDCDGKIDESNAQEICDGLDNDCDGNIDETLSAPLSNIQTGVCMGNLKVCQASLGFQEPGIDLLTINLNYENVESTCDGLDNDCDGNTDESIVLNPANQQMGVCQGQMKVCQGTLGIQEPNYLQILSYEIDESQCDGKDNDCDGQVDEVDQIADLQLGVCLGMMKICLGRQGFQEPNYQQLITNFETQETLCDHLDNDCDGHTDENLQNCCGDGIVQGGEDCDDGNLSEDDRCTNNCRQIVCGDGLVRGNEECEDGNLSNDDFCSSQCKRFRCGDDSTCPHLTWHEISSGRFDMGSITSEYTSPIHPVAVNQGFWITETEITVAQYRACVQADACSIPCQSQEQFCNWTPNSSDFDDHPINYVNWQQARAFANWVGGELPSEAQWEYVATSLGQNRLYPWGDTDPTCNYANFFKNSFCASSSGGTRPVCSSTLGNTDQGICDMAGNVWEWVLDDMHDSYDQAPANEQAWCADVGTCLLGNLKVFRGGSWIQPKENITTRYRVSNHKNNRTFDLGFRVIRPL